MIKYSGAAGWASAARLAPICDLKTSHDHAWNGSAS